MTMRCVVWAVLALAAAPVFAAPVTLERVAGLPAAEQPAWRKYLENSQALAQRDEAALQAEVKAQGLAAALATPDGGDFKMSAKPGDAYFGGAEAGKLADVILSYQAPSGGWSKHTGYNKGPRKPGMQWTSQSAPGEPAHYLATFDNRSTTEQMHFLAYVWHATKREDCKAAFVKGLEYIFAAQNPNGGWPQVFPLEGKYHDDVTFNDDGMTHVLQLLQEIGSDEPYYSFLDEKQKARAAKTLAAGIQCVLKTQLEVNGKRAVWCAQYDAMTLQPSPARALEPATLSGLESGRILDFLMDIRKPSPEVVKAIEGGLAWLEQAKVTQIRKTEQDGKTEYVADPESKEVYWARFYDLKTGKPVFPGRDGVVYETFEAMAAKNKVGYDYYSTLPGSVLNSAQKNWRKRMAAEAKG